VTAPVKLALVVTLPAVKPEAVPVMFVPTKADGVPKAGVTKVGLVANTKEPVPVSSVTAEARLALEGVAKNVATPVPRPETPLEIGRPVALVRVALEGVPKAGVTRVGDVDNTLLPEPVLVPTPVPPAATAIMSPLVPAYKSLTCDINSRIASLIPEGAQPSAILILSMSVLFAGVELHSLIFVFGISIPYSEYKPVIAGGVAVLRISRS
jgi:hypothetical protein